VHIAAGVDTGCLYENNSADLYDNNGEVLRVIGRVSVMIAFMSACPAQLVDTSLDLINVKDRSVSKL
jgi:hypothetical protein